MRFLNFETIYPRLNQEGLLPPNTAYQFDRIHPPESRGAQINNLVIRLRQFSEEELKTLICILRETASEAGIAHEELADTLEEKFEDYKKNGYTGMNIYSFLHCYIG